MSSSDGAFEGNLKEFLRLDGKLHRQFRKHLAGIAVHYKANGLFRGYAPLVAVKELVFTDF